MSASDAESHLPQAIKLLSLARACESAWNLDGPEAQAERDHRFEQFLAALENLKEHPHFELRKLGELSVRASRNMTLKTLMALIVPIERLAKRSASDEEFLRIQRPHLRDAEQKRSVPQQGEDLVILADHMRSAFNVGGLLRTGESLGASALWVTGYTPTPDEAPVQKTSMGAQLPCLKFNNVDEALRAAREQGFTPVALETTHDAVDVGAFRWPAKTLLIVGNERFGLEAATLQQITHRVRIPQFGRKNSMNVVVACGIAAHAWANQRVQRRSSIEPIATLRSEARYKQSLPRQGAWTNSQATRARVEMHPEFQGNSWPKTTQSALRDLEGFDYVWLIGNFHRADHWQMEVRPPRGDATPRSVWATRSPHRPNFLSLSCVRVESVDATGLNVSGIDLLDGTPIFDIKPYLPSAESFPTARGGWTDSIEQHRVRIELTPEFTSALVRAEADGESDLRDFIWEQLSFAPTDESRKRLRRLHDANEWELAFRYWRIRFELRGTSPSEISQTEGHSVILKGLQTAVPMDGETDDAEILRHRRFGRGN
ncbi:MAG TPA: tRNA (N6-threonylcarbamoyladenosine(37)-N6)-methyltransferase TrmO [Pseudobdellovibrionaceae bacterium]|nr:tRNA (N6-threonylcarbamoyladenosine(37)-N6)-methyltransferase TrmO [Pseudobdellovibrionaceae bacterium]